MKLLMLLPLPFALVSCLAYTAPESYTPTKGAASVSTGERKAGRPLRNSVKLPCRVAVVRLEKNRYSKKLELYGGKTVESPEHAAVLSRLRGLSGVISLNGILIEKSAINYDSLRSKARNVGADVLAVYRFESEQRSKSHSMLLSVSTLGAAPVHSTKSVSTVSLILLDARTGYVLGSIEEQASDKALSTSWGSSYAEDDVIEASRKEALDKLMQKLPDFWDRVTYKM